MAPSVSDVTRATRSYLLCATPRNGMRNLIDDPGLAGVAGELRERVARWMEETADPLRDGPVPLPPGAWVNDPDQTSAADPLEIAEDLRLSA